uniref:Uncharacterized protein n=1 Tax=Lepeophtheirus salmonis TaxID=72036 RepID=A0A0K2VGU5_LEPSM
MEICQLITPLMLFQDSKHLNEHHSPSPFEGQFVQVPYKDGNLHRASWQWNPPIFQRCQNHTT